MTQLLIGNSTEFDPAYLIPHGLAYGKVCIECFAIPKAELRRFCQNLGDEIVHFFMDNVKISDGSWGDILDILRGKLAARVQMKSCTVRIPLLDGGGAVDLIGTQEMGRIAEVYVTGKSRRAPGIV